MVRWAWLAVLLGVPACGGGDGEGQGPGCPTVEVFEDADFDGYGDPDVPLEVCESDTTGTADNGNDCDDHNVSVHPGQAEVCNGIDDDCDGEVDAQAEGAPSWYADADGDGHGDPKTTVAACELPAGFVPYAGDCDDSNAQTHPEAEERCDGEDNDCDGTVDNPEDLPVSVYYLDSDGDGYGDAKATIESCTEVPGYVWNDFDCDDSSDGIYPDAEEICGDEVDSNCDGKDCLDYETSFESGSLGPEWSTSGSPPWFVTSGHASEGSHSAECGDIGDNGQTGLILELEFLDAGEIRFFYDVSTESSYDYLQFYIDGVRQDEWSGTLSWAEAVYTVSAGVHSFEWRYDKDGSVSSGSDTVWIDQVFAVNGTPTE